MFALRARRLKPFGVRVTALRRQPWPARQAPAHAEPAQQQAGNGQQQAAQEAPTDQQQKQQHALDAAAEAVLADRGCWPHDSARLAAEADIIAGTHALSGQLCKCRTLLLCGREHKHAGADGVRRHLGCLVQ